MKGVFNLQEPGEHPYCGDGVDLRHGFSYDPEELMNSKLDNSNIPKEGIYFYNFSWPDLTNPPVEQVIKIC